MLRSKQGANSATNLLQDIHALRFIVMPSVLNTLACCCEAQPNLIYGKHIPYTLCLNYKQRVAAFRGEEAGVLVGLVNSEVAVACDSFCFMAFASFTSDKKT